MAHRLRLPALHAPDLLLLACGVVATVVYSLRGFEGALKRDLAVYSYAGQQLAEGRAPYEGILNRAGPLAHAVPGLGAWAGRLVGIDDIVAMRMLFMVLSVATVMAVYLVGRDLFASRAAGLASAAAMLSFEGFLRLATSGPREKTTMVLLVALCALALVHRRWATAGAMTALATLTWQPVAFPALAMLGVAALLGAGPGLRGRLRAVLRVAVGGAVPTALTVGFYAAIGQLQLFLDDFYLINARYTHQVSVLDAPLHMWEDMRSGYGWTVWVVYVGAVALVLHALVALVRPGRHEPRPAALVGLAVFVVVSVLWTLVAFNGWTDALVVLPVSALGVGSVVAAPRRWLPVRPVAVLALVAALVASLVSAQYARTSNDTLLRQQRAEARLVMGRMPPGSTLWAIEAPAPLVLLHRRNPSRVQLFGNGLAAYVDDTYPGGLAGYVRHIHDVAPELMVVGRQGRRPWLVPMLQRDYVRVGTGRDFFDWYVRRDLAPGRRAPLAKALKALARTH